MSRTKLKDYCQTHGFNMVSPVRENVNGYKFVTCLHSDSPDQPENLYLGTRFGESVTKGQKLDLSMMFVTETTNAGGEVRMKLTDREGDAQATLLANGYDLI